MRQGVVAVLEDAGFEVVAQAGDADDLVRKVGAHKPDVAIIDVRMPPDNTDDGLARRSRCAPSTRTCACWCCRSTSSPTTRRRSAGNAAGASATCSRTASATSSTSSTRSSAWPAADPRSTPRWSRTWSGAPAPDDPLERLTPREREVLELMAEGRSNAGDRRAVRRLRARRREARDEHLREARPGAGARGPPARARRARLPARLAQIRGVRTNPTPQDARSPHSQTRARAPHRGLMKSPSPLDIAARAGRWSARNRKKAIFGWLGFVVVALVARLRRRHQDAQRRRAGRRRVRPRRPRDRRRRSPRPPRSR